MKKFNKRRSFILTCLIVVLTFGLIAPAGISLPGISPKNVMAASKTTSAYVNMRKSYDTKSAVITVVPANVTVQWYDYQRGWYKVAYNGKIGWVYEEYFYGSKTTPSSSSGSSSSSSSTSTGSNVIDVKTVAENLNLRSSRSTASPANIIGLVPAGTKVGILSNYYNQWYQILIGKTRGWIVGGHFTTDTSRMNQRASSTATYGKSVKKITRRWVQLRSAMSMSASTKLMRVNSGTQLTVLDRKPYNWYQVNYDGITCYVRGGYFTNNNYKEVTTSRLNLRSSKTTRTSANIILTIPEGRKVTVKKCFNKSRWLKVKYNGITGYVKDGYFE